MRLRFGSPSLRVLIIFAIVMGIGFYLWDNDVFTAPLPLTSSTPPPVTAAVVITPIPTDSLISAAVSDTSESTPQPTPVTHQIAYRQEIPAGVSIFIPRAGIFSPIIQAYLDGTSWDVSQLGTRVGHLEGTAWVDEPGNVVLSGHVEMSDGRGGVFANLEELRIEDVIIIQTPDGEHRYIITEITTVSPNDLTPVMPMVDDRLTLITCNSYDFFTDSYLERMIVIAERLN